MKQRIEIWNRRSTKFAIHTGSAIACILIAAILLSSFLPKTEQSTSVVSGKQKVVKTKFVPATGEFRGVWISFMDIGSKKYTKKQYCAYIDRMFSDCQKKGFNAVIMHVRPFADALYPSDYFPWSKYISGKAGKSPGFDPLRYAVKVAHKKGLAFHAWINPYRITGDTTNVKTLPKASIARKWATSRNSRKRRNVLAWDGKLYFNPASKEVQNLVVKGVKEIVRNYAVDGIHLDDYFYPNLGTNYKKVFDSKEYKAYVKRCKRKKKKPASIVTWRRNNVSTMVQRLYKAVHGLDDRCVFGISPAGNLDNLYAKNNYYSDVKKWMRKAGYVDYICPQIYWSNGHKTCPFNGTVQRWLSLTKTESVKVYVGLAGYRAGISKKEAALASDRRWGTSRNNLQQQLQFLRTQPTCGGWILFSYSDLQRKSAQKEMRRFLQNLS